MRKILFDANFNQDEITQQINARLFEACKKIAPDYLFEGFSIEKMQEEFAENVNSYNINLVGINKIWHSTIPAFISHFNKGVPFYFPSGYISGFLPERTPVISMLTDSLPLVAARYMLKNEYLKNYKRRIQTDIHRSDLIFVLSESEKKLFSQKFLFLNEPVVLKVASLIPDEYLELPLPHQTEEYFYVDVENASPNGLDVLLKTFIYNNMTGKDKTKLYLVGDLKLVSKELLINLQVARKVDAIREYRNLSSGQKAALLRRAIAALILSAVEALPFAHLDAMKCSCPIVTENLPSVREICEDAVIYANSKNANDYNILLNKLKEDDLFRKEYKYRGMQRSKDFTWDEAAKTFIENIELLLSE